MSPERWQHVKEIGFAAMELAEDRRGEFIATECGSDSELRRAVEALVEEDGRSGDTVEREIAAAAVEVQRRRRNDAPDGMLGRTVSHYKIIEKLGAGGMGVVYKAEDTKLKRLVALKFLPVNELGGEAQKARFLREAQAAASLNHPNICTIHEIDESEGRTFIAMEFVDGQRVKEKIASRPQPLEEALDIAIQTAHGLRAAHQTKVVHRDIKPANLMLTTEGQVKVMDFGLAQPADATKITKTGSTLGTFAYMAPEQTMGERVDHRADIWSLGVVIYEMVTGRLPFPGEDSRSVVSSIQSNEPEPMTALRAGVPLELDWSVGKALAKERRERYQQVEEMIVDLQGLKKKLAAGKSTILPTQSAAVGPRASQMVVSRRRLRFQQGLLMATSVVLVALAVLHSQKTVPAPPLRRFSFTAPIQVFGGRPTSISPNGKHIAYTTEPPEGKLFVLDLDRGQVRSIEGTGVAWHPFWSPDSSSIGFSSRRGLMKVPVEGGRPIKVCQMPNTIIRHGTWSSDGGVIVFRGGPEPWQELYEVDALGGAPRRMTSPEQKEVLGKFSSPSGPHFLPSEAGSRVLVYSIGSATEQTMMVEDLKTGWRESLGPGVTPVYSPSGHIIYQPTSETRELWALPFSLDTLQATGKPFLITHNARHPTVAEDGTLVYHDPRLQRQLLWRDRNGKKTGEIGDPQDSAAYPTLSPDGRRLAFTARRTSGKDLWVLDLTRARVRQKVNTGSGRHASPAWSLDGMWLAYTVALPGDSNIHLRQANATGEENQLVATSDGEWLTDWSRDGKYILYERHGDQGVDHWYLERTDDGSGWEPRPFLTTPVRERAGKFSPDSRYVAYVSTESDVPEVYLQRFPEGGDKTKVSSNTGRQPLWSRDGKELFFISGDTLMAVAVSTDPILRVGTAESLFELPTLERSLWIAQYDFSTNRQHFIFSEPEGNVEPTIEVVQNWFAEFEGRQRN